MSIAVTDVAAIAATVASTIVRMIFSFDYASR